MQAPPVGLSRELAGHALVAGAMQAPPVGLSRELAGWRDMPKPVLGTRAVSVVLPCFEEAENVRELVARLLVAMRGADLRTEVVLVEDVSAHPTRGTAATRAVVEALRRELLPGSDDDVRLLVRPREAGRGLSSAVLEGLCAARHPVLVVMDADLQHEPESAPHVAAPVLEGVADFCIGSRNVANARVEDWPFHRQVISWAATFAALPLTACADPLSGFFSLSRATLERGLKRGLNPLGYKVGLELIVRCDCRRVQEVPIRFRERKQGESKLTLAQTVFYMQHLCHLYLHKLAELSGLRAWLPLRPESRKWHPRLSAPPAPARLCGIPEDEGGPAPALALPATAAAAAAAAPFEGPLAACSGAGAGSLDNGDALGRATIPKGRRRPSKSGSVGALAAGLSQPDSAGALVRAT